MYAVRARGRVTEDRRLEVEMPPEAEAGEVEVIVLYQVVANPPSVAAEQPEGDVEFIGMWADREDMQDPVAYVRELRRRAEKREDRHG